MPDRLAMEGGFFEKEGLKPRYIQFQGTNLMLNALLSGELDYVTIIPFIASSNSSRCATHSSLETTLCFSISKLLCL
jgi:ABC-type nitrate/sulfonate/bicarbonate transport system substrate-binding protein